MIKILIKQVENLETPKNANPEDSGYDITATSEPQIVGEKYENGLWKSIDYIQYETNLFIAPQKDNYQNSYHTLIFPRSSISKMQLSLANSIGLIDNGYRGMIMCRFNYLWQPGDYRMFMIDGGDKSPVGGKINMEKIYKRGDRIAQLVVEPTISVTWDVVNELPATDRGTGGFGSTGIQSPPVEMLETNHPAVKIPKYVQDIAGLYKDATEGIPHRKTYSELMRERNMEG